MGHILKEGCPVGPASRLQPGREQEPDTCARAERAAEVADSDVAVKNAATIVMVVADFRYVRDIAVAVTEVAVAVAVAVPCKRKDMRSGLSGRPGPPPPLHLPTTTLMIS